MNTLTVPTMQSSSDKLISAIEIAKLPKCKDCNRKIKPENAVVAHVPGTFIRFCDC